jgi:membrane dipeptidase
MSEAVFTLDTHIDIRWPDPPDPRVEGPMRVDFPKMERGGLRGAVFIAYVPQGKRDAAGHADAAARAEAMLRHICGRADDEARRFCANAAELEAAAGAGAFAVLSAVENGYAMGRDLGAVARWRALGACYLTLTHDGHNDLADSARPRSALGDQEAEHGGLSALGRDAIGALNRAGMMVDVSHVSKAGMMQAAEASRSPVVATHTACRALRDHPRNIDDEQLDALRHVGGLVQVTAVSAFLRAPPHGGAAAEASVEDMADHVDHAVRRIGVEHVGLSSDFDGGGGVRGWENAAETGGLTAALRGRGYGPSEIGMLWSGNFLRVMRAAEAVARG